MLVNWVIGDLAALAVGVGGADAETECGGGGKKHGLHGLSPELPVLGAGLLGVCHPTPIGAGDAR